jgi:hypothetical protein
MLSATSTATSAQTITQRVSLDVTEPQGPLDPGEAGQHPDGQKGGAGGGVGSTQGVSTLSAPQSCAKTSALRCCAGRGQPGTGGRYPQ